MCPRLGEQHYSIVVTNGDTQPWAHTVAGGEHELAKDKKKDKKRSKKNASGGRAAKAASRLKGIADNPLVADLVAAALVGAAAALKDTKKARALAAHAGEELETLAREGAERGNAMWQLALDVGRRSLESLIAEPKKPSKKKAPKAPAASKPAVRKAKPRAKSKPRTKAAK